METYLIVIGKTNTGYSAHCPDVPACAATGGTVEEVVRNMKEALEFHFEGLAEDGEPIPEPGGVHSYEQILEEGDSDQYLMAHVSLDTSRFSSASPS
jgi:predicted RNase H-like HicB family nuclease